MRSPHLLFASAAFTLLGHAAPLATAGRPHSTSPACPLACPAGYRVAVYSWELHPERTNYDETGKVQVPPDAVWHVTCSLKCEQHAPNEETKFWSDKKPLCDSGAEPGPYTGPWRITGQFTRECDAREPRGCTMQCYDVKKPKPAKGAGKGRPKK